MKPQKNNHSWEKQKHEGIQAGNSLKRKSESIKLESEKQSEKFGGAVQNSPNPSTHDEYLIIKKQRLKNEEDIKNKIDPLYSISIGSFYNNKEMFRDVAELIDAIAIISYRKGKAQAQKEILEEIDLEIKRLATISFKHCFEKGKMCEACFERRRFLFELKQKLQGERC